MPMNSKLLLRQLQLIDCETIPRAFTAQGWNKPVEQYLRYLEEQTAEMRVVIVAEYENEFAGYLTIEWISRHDSFQAQQIPEITDLNVLREFQRRGIATALLNEAERRVGAKSPIVGIAVGLTADYGAAQILYARRGYVPDGRGVSQRNHHPNYGEVVMVDDNLVLSLTKGVESGETLAM